MTEKDIQLAIDMRKSGQWSYREIATLFRVSVLTLKCWCINEHRTAIRDC